MLCKVGIKNQRDYGKNGLRGITLKNVMNDTLKKDRDLIKK